MTTTKGGRLKIARDKLGLSQGFIGAIIGCKQTHISKRESNETQITYEEAMLLQQHPDVGISAEWLMNGTGDMFFTAANEVKEPGIVYKSLRVDTTDAGINKRFVMAVEYEGHQRHLSKTEVSNALNISISHWSQIKNGSKNVTAPILADAVLSLGIDANFVLVRKETQRTDVTELTQELERLKKENENLQLMVSLFKDKFADTAKPEQHKKRA